MPNSSVATPRVVWTLNAVFMVSQLPAEAWSAAAPPFDGHKLYDQYCSVCYDHPQGRIPALATIAAHPADEVLQTLTIGLMRAQAAGLNLNERTALATFVTGKSLSGNLAAPP